MGDYPAFKRARGAGRLAVSKGEIMTLADLDKLNAVIEESLENPEASLKERRKQNKLPFSDKALAEKRKEYCYAYLASLQYNLDMRLFQM